MALPIDFSTGYLSAFFSAFAAAAERISISSFDATIGSLLNVRDEMDPLALEKAIAALSSAKRAEFYGFGASGSVAITLRAPGKRGNTPS